MLSDLLSFCLFLPGAITIIDGDYRPFAACDVKHEFVNETSFVNTHYACSQVTTLRNTETWNTIHLTPYSLFYLIFFICLYMFISFHFDDTVPLTVYLASVHYYCKSSCRYFCFAGECAC